MATIWVRELPSPRALVGSEPGTQRVDGLFESCLYVHSMRRAALSFYDPDPDFKDGCGHTGATVPEIPVLQKRQHVDIALGGVRSTFGDAYQWRSRSFRPNTVGAIEPRIDKDRILAGQVLSYVVCPRRQPDEGAGARLAAHRRCAENLHATTRHFVEPVSVQEAE